MNKDHLIKCIECAIERDVRYVGIKVNEIGLGESIRIYHKSSFKSLLDHLKASVEDDLTYRDVDITGFAYGENFYNIEAYLKGVKWK